MAPERELSGRFKQMLLIENGMGRAIAAYAEKKSKGTGADDGCLPEYEKTLFHPADLGEGESFSILKNSQGAVPLPLLRKNEWAEIAERGFCEEARALVRGKGRGLRSWR
ncbi:hypothetical protein [Halobacillus litoralis]|uniref:hypothetical protein n=1 Tax=Halobacillus litoralis TaxID=45668 RepID=UPI001CD67262|nr:hypothetical protein [Halobacillus litoralis]MCA1021032.1 hypothetical protein [Halobacillus litoralis]